MVYFVLLSKEASQWIMLNKKPSRQNPLEELKKAVVPQSFIEQGGHQNTLENCQASKPRLYILTYSRW